MVLKRSPCMAFLFVLAMLLFAMPCFAKATDTPSFAEELPELGSFPDIPANDSLDITFDVSVPDIGPPANVSPAVGPSIAPEEPSNVSANGAGVPILSGQYEAAPAPTAVSGTIYATSGGARWPWPDGHISVYVNGVQATVTGSTYSATITPADHVEVALIHDCGYLLGMSRSAADMSGVPLNIDIEAPALEVSGDVYAEDQPADGASLLVYLNDRPYGPVNATSGHGPMFSMYLPGGHPGDRVSIAASRGDSSGIVCQDVSNYYVFLTVNLKSTAAYLTYAGPATHSKAEKRRLMPIPMRLLCSDRL